MFGGLPRGHFSSVIRALSKPEREDFASEAKILALWRACCRP